HTTISPDVLHVAGSLQSHSPSCCASVQFSHPDQPMYHCSGECLSVEIKNIKHQMHQGIWHRFSMQICICTHTHTHTHTHPHTHTPHLPLGSCLRSSLRRVRQASSSLFSSW